MLAVAAIAALTASLLVALAAPVAAGESFNFTWGGNGYPNETCDENSETMLWIWTGDATPTGLTINGEAQSGSWEQKGNGSWHFTATIDGDNFPPEEGADKTFVTLSSEGDGVLTLSHCDGTSTPTPTPEGSVDEGTGTPSPTPEGSQLGGTGTPAPSVPDTAMSLSNLSGPLATVAFGMILLASLGALAYANVRSVRRRS